MGSGLFQFPILRWIKGNLTQRQRQPNERCLATHTPAWCSWLDTFD
jgi:hypothetical protein